MPIGTASLWISLGSALTTGEMRLTSSGAQRCLLAQDVQSP